METNEAIFTINPLSSRFGGGDGLSGDNNDDRHPHIIVRKETGREGKDSSLSCPHRKFQFVECWILRTET